MKALSYILLFSLVFLGACKKAEQPNFHYEYFGLQQNRYVIYDVVSILHDEQVGVHDTSNYQIKTVWKEVYIDNEGREAREYYRYYRSTSSDDWQVQDVWTGIIDGARAELIEENQRKVKLVFAPSLQKEWDANAYNILGTQDCYYRDIHKDTTLNNVFIDSTVVVVQDDPLPSLVDTIYAYEMYAKNIGLVYKHDDERYFDFGVPLAREGHEFYMTYNSHGFE